MQGATDTLDPALATRHRPLRFAPTRCGRQNDVSHLTRGGQKDILHDEDLKSLEKLHGPLLVCFRLSRVFANDVERSEVPMFHRLKHTAQVQAAFRRDLHPPGLFKSRAQFVILHMLKSRQPVRNGTHVSAPLHIVLSTQGVETRSVTSHVACQQSQIQQG